jgi:hypothetical protein
MMNEESLLRKGDSGPSFLEICLLQAMQQTLQVTDCPLYTFPVRLLFAMCWWHWKCEQRVYETKLKAAKNNA